MKTLRTIACIVGLTCTLACFGCSRDECIRSYTVPKPHVLYEQNHDESTSHDHDAARPRLPAPETKAASGSPRLTYEVPEGWTEGRAGGMRQAAFEVSDGDRKVEITVITAGGDLLAHVNRWRDQIQLDPVTQEQLDREVQQIEIDESTGSYVQLIGPESATPQESILAVVVCRGRTTRLVKLKGDSDLAARERERFEAFVRSLAFLK